MEKPVIIVFLVAIVSLVVLSSASSPTSLVVYSYNGLLSDSGDLLEQAVSDEWDNLAVLEEEIAALDEEFPESDAVAFLTEELEVLEDALEDVVLYAPYDPRKAQTQLVVVQRARAELSQSIEIMTLFLELQA